MVQSTTAADSTTTMSVLQVINVEKHAASPKAIADLKAAALLAESLEPKPGGEYYWYWLPLPHVGSVVL